MELTSLRLSSNFTDPGVVLCHCYRFLSPLPPSDSKVKISIGFLTASPQSCEAVKRSPADVVRCGQPSSGVTTRQRH